jgi:hypothetical protein
LRKLNKREQRLGLVLFVALFAMANFYGLGYLIDRKDALERNVAELAGQKHSNEIWLKEKDLWLSRRNWIEQKQPKIVSSQVPQSEFLEALVGSAKKEQLEIQEQSFGEIKSTPNYRSVAVRLKLTGSLQNVIKWLVDVQQPELFQAVTNFSLKSVNEPPTVSLELEIARWYAPTA